MRERVGEGQSGIEPGGDEIIAKAFHGGEFERLHAQGPRGLDVDQLVVDEESFLRLGS